MDRFDSASLRVVVSHFVPVELQRRGFHDMPIFAELAEKGFKPIPGGAQQVHPWVEWQGLSTYLDCIAYADRSARDLPKDQGLNLTHVTPGQYHSASIIFFTEALLDNIATWISDAFPLPIKGGERNFRSSHFKRELKKRANAAVDVVSSHEPFVDEVNRYRQVWIHTLAGGSIPIADDNPFTNPETAKKVLGVPIDPAIQISQENYIKRIEECAIKNGGKYYYELGEFTGRIFAGSSRFYMDWLRFVE